MGFVAPQPHNIVQKGVFNAVLTVVITSIGFEGKAPLVPDKETEAS